MVHPSAVSLHELAYGARISVRTLVTENVREFGRVPGLSVIDWSDPAGIRSYPA